MHTIYKGMLERCPRIVVDQSTFVTSTRTCGRNHILEFNEFSAIRLCIKYMIKQIIPMVCSMVLAICNLIVCSRGIICPCFLRHDQSGNGLVEQGHQPLINRISHQTYLEVVKIQYFVQRRPISHTLLTCFLFISYLYFNR